MVNNKSWSKLSRLLLFPEHFLSFPGSMFSINFLSFNFKLDTMKYLTFEKSMKYFLWARQIKSNLSNPISYFLCIAPVSFSKGHLMLHALNYNNVLIANFNEKDKVQALQHIMQSKQNSFSQNIPHFHVYDFQYIIFGGNPSISRKGKKEKID